MIKINLLGTNWGWVAYLRIPLSHSAIFLWLSLLLLSLNPGVDFLCKTKGGFFAVIFTISLVFLLSSSWSLILVKLLVFAQELNRSFMFFFPLLLKIILCPVADFDEVSPL